MPSPSRRRAFVPGPSRTRASADPGCRRRGVRAELVRRRSSIALPVAAGGAGGLAAARRSGRLPVTAGVAAAGRVRRGRAARQRDRLERDRSVGAGHGQRRAGRTRPGVAALGRLRRVGCLREAHRLRVAVAAAARRREPLPVGDRREQRAADEDRRHEAGRDRPRETEVTSVEAALGGLHAATTVLVRHLVSSPIQPAHRQLLVRTGGTFSASGRLFDAAGRPSQVPRPVTKAVHRRESRQTGIWTRISATPARACALAVLRRVFEEGAWADRALHAEARRLAWTRASARWPCGSPTARSSGGPRSTT